MSVFRFLSDMPASLAASALLGPAPDRARSSARSSYRFNEIQERRITECRQAMPRSRNRGSNEHDRNGVQAAPRAPEEQLAAPEKINEASTQPEGPSSGAL
jgi:hypothetical protein